jgi:predicted transcriptional regulator
MPESTNWHYPDSDEYTAQRKEMQKLEYELAEARETIRHLQMENGLIKFYECEERNKELLHQRDTLVEALKMFIEEQCEYRPHEHSNALGVARNALATMKGGES